MEFKVKHIAYAVGGLGAAYLVYSLLNKGFSFVAKYSLSASTDNAPISCAATAGNSTFDSKSIRYQSLYYSFW